MTVCHSSDSSGFLWPVPYICIYHQTSTSASTMTQPHVISLLYPDPLHLALFQAAPSAEPSDMEHLKTASGSPPNTLRPAAADAYLLFQVHRRGRRERGGLGTGSGGS